MNNPQVGVCPVRLFQRAKFWRAVLVTAFLLGLPPAAVSGASSDTTAKANASSSGTNPSNSNCSPALSALTIHGDIVVVVDPDTNIGSGIFKLTNDSNCAFLLNLSATDFETVQDEKKWNLTPTRLGATAATFTPVDLTTKAFFPPDLKKMNPHDTATIKIDVQKLWEAGEATASLQQDGRGFATIYASRLRVSFTIKNGMAAGDEDPVFYKGRKGFLSITNDDKVTYPVTWELLIDGKRADSGYDYLLPGQTHLPITLGSDFFRLPSSGTLQDDVERALLAIRFDPPRQVQDTHLTSKDILFPKVHLRYFSKTPQQLVNLAWVIVLLAVGAGISIALNVGIPNQLKRNETRKRLKESSKRINALDVTADHSTFTSLIEARNRVVTSLRVERSQLENRLHEAYWFSPNLSVELPLLDQAIGLLNSRTKVVALVQELQEDLLTAATLPKVVGSMPPSLIDDALALCASKLRDAARPDLIDTDIPALLATVTAMQQRIATLGATDSLATTIPGLESNLKSRIPSSAQDAATIGSDVLWNVFKGLELIFKSVTTASPSAAPDEYFSRDMAIQIALACADYIDFRQRLSNNAIITSADADARKMVALFSLQTYSALIRGRDILECIREGVSIEKLREALRATPPKAEIEVTPATPKAYELVQLRVTFSDNALNTDAARHLLRCKWSLPTVPPKYGWTIAHYFNWDARFKQFRKPWETKVIAEFLDADAPLMTTDGSTIVVQLEKRVSVRAERNQGRLLVAILRTGLALLVPLLALVAIEQSQIANLSLVPAALAVLVAGMTADTIKNALMKA